MRELPYLISDVREQTDNRDTNGVKDREFIRYFNDGVKTIQAIIFKNNPLCNFYQESVIFSPTNGTREYDLPSDCYGDNAVSMIELEGNSHWYPIERVWPEDGANFFGWFVRGKKIVISGCEDRNLSQRIRVWYFKRIPRFDKSWAKVTGVAGQVITLTDIDSDLFQVDRFASFKQPDGSDRLDAIPFVKTSATTITATGDITTVVANDLLTMGKKSSMTLDIPDECEPYLLDYVAKRVYGRNNYGTDASKLDQFTEEERSNIIAIFADASQALVRAPITDTEYLRI